jgi:hypothetical protein
MTISGNTNECNVNATGNGAMGRGIFNLNNNVRDSETRATVENERFADGFAAGFRKGSDTENGQWYNTGVQNGYANGSVVSCNAMIEVIYTMRMMHPQQRRDFLNLLSTITEV